jgi:hypothetical protein
MIDLEYLQTKKRQYNDAYMEHLGLANANRGAEQAIDELIATFQAASAATPDETPVAEIMPPEE